MLTGFSVSMTDTCTHLASLPLVNTQQRHASCYRAIRPVPLPKVDADFYRAQQEDSAPDAHHLDSSDSAGLSLLHSLEQQAQPHPAKRQLRRVEERQIRHSHARQIRHAEEDRQIRATFRGLMGAAGAAKRAGRRLLVEAAGEAAGEAS